LAFRDAAIVLAYIYKNYEEIVELPDSLDILLKEIILNGSLDSMIDIDAKNFVDNNTQRPKNQNGNNQITEESCCAIF
jgi:hypothetical protein